MNPHERQWLEQFSRACETGELDGIGQPPPRISGLLVAISQQAYNAMPAGMMSGLKEIVREARKAADPDEDAPWKDRDAE
jgi:hypothetical protein